MSSEAQDDLSSLERDMAERIIKKLLWLAGQVNPVHFVKRLHGKDTHYSRFRIGDYRAIVFIQTKSKVILVIHLGHRRDVYR